jgi:D-sedoheptulose 7-phosphate isomerase
MVKDITNIIQKSIDIKRDIISDTKLLNNIEEVINLIVNCYKSDGKVLFCGNGGSAADSQHLAAELSGRFYFDRDPLASEALHVNTSYITAVANDYSYDQIYSRYIKAVGKKGDILIGLSTSGKSSNIIKAFKEGKNKGMICIGFCGQFSEMFSEYCDLVISIPSNDTPRIQECHMIIGHTVCQKVEEIIFKNKK